MRQLERNVLLNVIDRKWREHLYEMDYLREGIGSARDGAARPGGRVPARGLRHVHRHARRAEGGVGRLPVQRHRGGGARAPAAQVAPVAAPPAWPSSPRPPRRRAVRVIKATERARRMAPAPWPPRSGTNPHRRPCAPRESTDEAPPLTYSGPSEDGSAQVQRSGGGPRHAAPSRAAGRAGSGARPPVEQARRPRPGAARQGFRTHSWPPQPICRATIRQPSAVRVRRGRRWRARAGRGCTSRTPQRRSRRNPRPVAAAPGAAWRPRCAGAGPGLRRFESSGGQQWPQLRDRPAPVDHLQHAAQCRVGEGDCRPRWLRLRVPDPPQPAAAAGVCGGAVRRATAAGSRPVRRGGGCRR